jgi:type I restriction enzyme S subunit
MEMNIPEGYKQTDVSAIPKDWKVKEISSISEAVRGGSPRPAGSPKFFGGSYIPWLTVASLTNIPESSLYVSKTVGFLTEEGAKYSRTLEKGTLIIANSGATLGVAKILLLRCCANDGSAALIDLSKDVDKLFLCYFLNTKTREFREVIAPGNGQPNLNTTLIGLTKVPLPPTIEEQKAIAQSLSDVDALIAALDQLITKKRNIKQGTMQQLLTGKKRLPSFSGEWKVKKLGEIAEITMGQSPLGSSYNKNGQGIPLVNGPTEFTKKYPIKIQWTTSPTKICKREDILLCIRGSSTGRINISNDEYCIGRGIASIRSTAKSSNLFLEFQVQSVVERILTLSAGSTFPNIDGKSLKNIEIVAPSLQEQQAIAQILSDMDAEIEALEQKRDKYKALKQGMMQELLTGKTRLID